MHPTDQIQVLLQSNCPGLTLLSRGKVRDIYELEENLLIVATDRISAFDCILASGIPRKGEVLTRISQFWFERLRGVVPNHMLTTSVEEFPEELRPFQDQLRGRSMVAKRLRMIDIECVARGYLSGSGWKEYQRTGSVCGIQLPESLRESSKLPEPIFTPASKAETGHDENVTFEYVANRTGGETAERLRRLTLELYKQAGEYAETRGIIIADTKFEFGWLDGDLVLGDEALTPDSSRFWPKDTYRAGGPQPSYDKQFVRDYLEEIRWDKHPPAPALPTDVVRRTSDKYMEAYRLLTGTAL